MNNIDSKFFLMAEDIDREFKDLPSSSKALLHQIRCLMEFGEYPMFDIIHDYFMNNEDKEAS